MKTHHGLALLRASLRAWADTLLHLRGTRELPERYIDDYVRLGWLKWSGYGLQITPVGQNICRRKAANDATAPDMAIPVAANDERHAQP